MMAITPIGTDTFLRRSPSEVVRSVRIRPTGSDRSITSLIPWAIPSILSLESIRRSSITSLTVPRTASTSWALAPRIKLHSASRASAITPSALFFSVFDRVARYDLAFLAAASISCVVIASPLGKETGSNRPAVCNLIKDRWI